MERQREEQTPVYGPEGIHAQVAALVATLVSTLLSIGVLLGIEAQQQGHLPREAGSRLTRECWEQPGFWMSTKRTGL